MRKPRLAPILRGPIRLLISALALVTGLSHSAGFSASPNNPGPDVFAVPPNALLPQYGCGDGGDGGNGGDTCQYTYDCNYFCGCDCYYGFMGGGCY